MSQKTIDSVRRFDPANGDISKTVEELLSRSKLDNDKFHTFVSIMIKTLAIVTCFGITASIFVNYLHSPRGHAFLAVVLVSCLISISYAISVFFRAFFVQAICCLLMSVLVSIRFFAFDLGPVDIYLFQNIVVTTTIVLALIAFQLYIIDDERKNQIMIKDLRDYISRFGMTTKDM